MPLTIGRGRRRGNGPQSIASRAVTLATAFAVDLRPAVFDPAQQLVAKVLVPGGPLAVDLRHCARKRPRLQLIERDLLRSGLRHVAAGSHRSSVGRASTPPRALGGTSLLIAAGQAEAWRRKVMPSYRTPPAAS